MRMFHYADGLVKEESEMRVEDNRSVSTAKTAADLPVGYYKGSTSYHKDRLFIRTFDRVVDASNPTNTWGLKVPAEGWVRVHGVIKIERNA